MKKFFIFVLFFSINGWSALPSVKPAGINGTIGAGFAKFFVTKPATNFKLDQGVYAALTGEKGFDVLNLYLNLTISYLTSTGQTNYDYTTLAGQHYTAAATNFNLELFQAGLGLKMKLIDGYWFRPYVEAGGVGGYYTLKYTNNQNVLQAQGTNYKTTDSIIDGGWYSEGGLEISFSTSFGIKAAARFVDSETKTVDTLAASTIKYKTEVYYFSLLKSF